MKANAVATLIPRVPIIIAIRQSMWLRYIFMSIACLDCLRVITQGDIRDYKKSLVKKMKL